MPAEGPFGSLCHCHEQPIMKKEKLYRQGKKCNITYSLNPVSTVEKKVKFLFRDNLKQILKFKASYIIVLLIKFYSVVTLGNTLGRQMECIGSRGEKEDRDM